jgi:hypothetical protein
MNRRSNQLPESRLQIKLLRVGVLSPLRFADVHIRRRTAYGLPKLDIGHLRTSVPIVIPSDRRDPDQRYASAPAV